MTASSAGAPGGKMSGRHALRLRCGSGGVLRRSPSAGHRGPLRRTLRRRRLARRLRPPASIPTPAGNPVTTEKVDLGRSLFAIRASRARAISPARRATIRPCPSRTAWRAAPATTASRCRAARHRCGTWPGASPSSGTGARRRSRRRRAGRSRTRARWAGTSLWPRAPRGRSGERPPVRRGVPGRPARERGQHPRRAGGVRAHARLAADALRPLGQGRRRRARSGRARRLPARSSARRAASPAITAGASPTRRSTTSACPSVRTSRPRPRRGPADRGGRARLQDALAARAPLDRALHARRLAGDARGGGRPLRRRRGRAPDAVGRPHARTPPLGAGAGAARRLPRHAVERRRATPGRDAGPNAGARRGDRPGRADDRGPAEGPPVHARRRRARARTGAHHRQRRHAARTTCGSRTRACRRCRRRRSPATASCSGSRKTAATR